jgi:hypothetical protein
LVSLGGGVIKETVLDGDLSEPEAALAYLFDMTAQMRDLAADIGCPMIVYLLQMATLEILETIDGDEEDSDQFG